MIEKKDISQQVEERLIDAQKSKEFKDIGRVSGSRKAAAAFKLITMQSLEQIEQDPVMAYKMVKKEAVFPKFDPIEQKALGITSGACFLKTKIRESVSSKPKDTPLARAAYVKFCDKLYNDLLGCKTIFDIRSLTDVYYKWDEYTSAVYLIDPNLEGASAEDINTAHALKRRELKKYYSLRTTDLIKDLVGVGFVNMFFRGSDAAISNWNEAQYFNEVSKEEEQKNIEKQKAALLANYEKEKNLLEKVSTLNTEDFHRYVSKYYRNVPSLREFKNEQNIWGNEARYRRLFQENFDKAKKRYENPVELSKGYKAQEEDWSWAEIKSTSQPKQVTKSDSSIVSLKINTKQPLDYIRRDNGYGIPEVAAISVVDYFGFKAVNYGNYVNDRESKQHTKHLLGALSDLGEILNMDVKQLNQLGGLSLGIGLKGRPGALATYFAQTKDINLTKNNGDGSLCHEWGHYLDNAIADLGEVKATNLGFGSQGKAVKPLTAQRFKILMDALVKGAPGLDLICPIEIQSSKEKPMRFYSAHTRTTYDPDIYLKATWEETLQEIKPLMVWQKNATSNQYLEKFIGRILGHFDMPATHIDFKMDGMSKYFLKSTFQGSPYWIQDVELFARAFETYVYIKLQAQNRFSTYLVALDWNIFGVSIKYGSQYFENNMPYPTTAEAKAFEPLFDSLMKTIKMEYGIGDFVPYSYNRVSEYIELEKSSKEMKVKDGVEVVKKPKGKVETIKVTEQTVVQPIKEPIVEPAKPEEKEEQPGWGESVPELIQGLEVLASLSEGKEKQEVEDLIEGLKLLL